jgi:hypothetical protein
VTADVDFVDVGEDEKGGGALPDGQESARLT